MTEEPEKLSKDDPIRFHCHNDLSCFNQCCRDISIVLTPYDILRLKRRLGISSEEFLAKYTISPFTKDQKIPVVLLKMDEENEKRCPLVSDQGCSVYEDRPWACRMYPLGLASPKTGGTDKPFYFLLEEPLCQGLKEPRELTVGEYLAEQEIRHYDRMGEPFKEVTLHDYLLQGGDLGPQKMEMFHTVCYNLDKFRRLVFSDPEFFKLFEVEDTEKELMEKDDEVLLLFGFRFLRFSLFGEPILEVTDRARQRVSEKVEALKKSEEAKKTVP